MRKISIALAAGVAMSALSPAMAQEVAAPAAETTAPAEASAPAAAPAQAPAAAAEVLLSGAEVHLATRSELSSRTSVLGDRFELEVTQDVSHNGQVVIPRGSIATGEVTRVRKKGMWGRSGILETRLVSVRAGDRQIRLSGAAGDRGRAGTAAAVGAVLLSPLIVAPFVGFFVTGTSAVIPAQTATIAYTDENVPVLLAAASAESADAAPAMPAATETTPVADPAAPAPAAPVPAEAPTGA